MQSNPFSPPRALVEDLPDDELDARPRRPLSVWTLQVLAALAAGAVAIGVVAVAGRLLFDHAANVPDQVFKLCVDFLVTALLVATIVGSQRRRRLARWAGLALIALIFGFLAWIGIEVVTSSISAPRHVDGSASRSTTAALGILALAIGPTGFWFWAYGFSAKARTWFAPRPRVSQAPR